MIALNLYHKLNFGQLHARFPAIRDLAERLKRSSGSVAMKLCNFASLDPALKLRGIRGLVGASNLDREIWSEFHENLEDAVPASEQALRDLFEADENGELQVSAQAGIRILKNAPIGPTEGFANVKLRRGQEYFRAAVLNNFGGRCGITRIAIRELLVASHILPWAGHRKYRLDVRNGLCLSRLHDAAFDRGLIAFDEELRLLLSPKLKAEIGLKALAANFGDYEGQRLIVPEDATLPDPDFVRKHRTTHFRVG